MQKKQQNNRIRDDLPGKGILSLFADKKLKMWVWGENGVGAREMAKQRPSKCVLGQQKLKQKQEKYLGLT